MTTPTDWRKSSYSGSGDGNACVEVAIHSPHISVRDSKAPTRTPLTFPAPAFATFLESLKKNPATRPGTEPDHITPRKTPETSLEVS